MEWPVEGNDMLRILPAKQGSQIGSGFAEDWSVRPDPKSADRSFLMSAMLWWHKRGCSRLRSSGIVETLAAASGGTVVPFKTAEQLEVVVAVNKRPSGRSKLNWDAVMVMVYSFCIVT